MIGAEPFWRWVPKIVKGDPFASVSDMDDAAVNKPILFDGGLHREIVFVGVDPQIVTPVMAKVETGPGDAFGDPVGGKPVNGAVGLVTAPASVLNFKISGIFADDQGKDTDDFAAAFIYTNSAAATVVIAAVVIEDNKAVISAVITNILADTFANLLAYVEIPIGDVIFDHASRRSSGAPLGGISVVPHKSSGLFVDIHDFR